MSHEIFSNDGLDARFDNLLVSGESTVSTIKSEEYNQQPKAPLASSPNIFPTKGKGIPSGTEDHDNFLFTKIQPTIKGEDEDDTYSSTYNMTNGSISMVTASKENRQTLLMKSAKLFQTGRMHLLQNRDEEAMKDFQLALKTQQDAEGGENGRSGKMLIDMGDIWCNDRGNARKALKCYSAAKRMLQYKSASKNMLAILNRLGFVLQERAQFNKAWNFFDQANKMHIKLGHKANHFLNDFVLSRSYSLLGLGDVNTSIGSYKEAMTFYDKALKIQTKHFGRNDPTVASIIHRIGVLYCEQGNFKEAQHLLNESLFIRQKALPKTHIDIGQSLNSIGILHSSKGNKACALDDFSKSLIIRTTAFGNEHIDVMRTKINIAVLVTDKETFAKSLKLFHDAERVTKEVLRVDHPFIGDIRVNMGNSFLKVQSDHKLAMGCYEEALRVYQLCELPKNHIKIVRVMNIMTRLNNMGNFI